MRQNKDIRYHFWDKAIAAAFGGYAAWSWYKQRTLPDQYAETLNDLVCCYCMGGEL